MGTSVFYGKDGAITQVANAWVVDPAAPVLFRSNRTPGFAPHSNTSKKIWNPLASIDERGAQFANRYSAMDTGKHAPTVAVGRPTMVRDHPNGFLSWAKNVLHEAGEMVHHGVTTAVNSIMMRLSPGVLNAIKNGEAVLKGMNGKHFKNAAEEQVEALMEMLKDPATYGGLAVSLAATAVQGVPVVGQVVGGAVAIDRAIGTGQAAMQAVQELQDIMSTWGQPMTPEQLEAARERLAKWMVGGGAALMAALVGKTFQVARNARSEKRYDNDKAVNSDQHNARNGPCSCALGSPVLIVTGEKLLDETDFELPGPIPIVWRRRYRSGDLETSPWGTGWSYPLGVELRLGATHATYRDEQGRHISLPLLEPGQKHFELSEALTLRRDDDTHWAIEFKTGLTLHFQQTDITPWRLPLLAQTDRNGNRVQLQWQTPTPERDPAADFVPPRLIGVTDSVGRQLRVHWQGRRLARVELLLRGGAAHELVRYDYDNHYVQCQLATTHLGGNPWRHYAWRGGVLVGYRKGDGARYFADYDTEGPHGRVLRSWCADTGEGYTFRYDLRERTTWATDALGRTTGYHFNAGFDIIETIAPDGTVTQTPMNAAHLPLGSVDALGRRSTNRFDARGNLIAHTSADGATTRLEYNALDLPVRITDAMGQVWQRQYDERGNLSQVTDPLGHTTHYEYDARGNVTAIIDALGKRKSLEWDTHANLSRYTDCSSHATDYRHDVLGRLRERQDALGHTTHYGWNARGQLIEVAEADGARHHYAWDGEGHLLAYTDPLGAVTRWRYDGSGRPLQRQDAAGRWLHYRYDAAGRLLQLTNENQAHTRFAYDLADNLTDEVGFDGRWQRYVYNAAGELTHLIEAGGGDAGPGKLTTFERDAMGRLLAKHAHAAQDMAASSSQYRYDLLGRLLAANNASAQLRFVYDPLGQLLQQTQIDTTGVASRPRPGRPLQEGLPTGTARTLSHRYDALGNRIQTTLPDGRSLHYLHYGSGHLHQIELQQPDGTRQLISDIERDALHREVQRSQGRLHSRYDWDPMGRLLRHKVSRPSASAETAGTRIERRYQWDLAGQLSARADSLRGAQQFAYDPTGRIRSALGGPLGPELFAFDPAGNLLDEPPPGAASAPALILNNRIRVHQDLRYAYDLHGNVTERHKGAHESALFTWNAEHQLQSAEVRRHGVTQSTTYRYDALGRRIAKTGTFASTRYLWDGDLLVHTERGHHSSLYCYEPSSFVPLATVQGTTGQQQTYWYQCDQVGVPQELTDEQGNIVWAADYKAWGQGQPRALATGTDGRSASAPGPMPIWYGWEGTGDHESYLRGQQRKGKSPPNEAPLPIEQPFRLQGQHFDEETGLHYNRFRYCDPCIGRFVSQDPIGLAGGTNLFTYGHNWQEWTDPWGLAGRRGRPIPTHDKSGRPTSSPNYSKWHGLTMPCHLLGGTREDHFRWANEQLHNQLQADPALAKALGPDVVSYVKPGPRGGVNSGSPPGLTWHHSAQDPTHLELIPRGQHQSPGAVQETLHPNQQGGFKKLNCK